MNRRPTSVKIKPMIRKEKFCPGEYYHVYSRTVLNMPEFKNIRNADKLAQTFLLGNSTNSAQAFEYLRNNKDNPDAIQKAVEIIKEGEKLVDILCYVIMHDHYHLLIKELRNNGITDFIRRCNTSIAKYINIKFNRSGPLFESNFKAKHIDSNEYLRHLSIYIHLNPLDFLIDKSWRYHNLKNWEYARNKLLDYPWSSLKAFLDKNFKNQIISGREIIINQFKNGREYEEFLQEWTEIEKEEIKDIIID